MTARLVGLVNGEGPPEGFVCRTTGEPDGVEGEYAMAVRANARAGGTYGAAVRVNPWDGAGTNGSMSTSLSSPVRGSVG